MIFVAIMDVDINRGTPFSATRCPLCFALERAGFVGVRVERDHYSWLARIDSTGELIDNVPEGRQYARLSRDCIKWLRRFDRKGGAKGLGEEEKAATGFFLSESVLELVD